MAQMVKTLPVIQETPEFDPWIRKIPRGGHGNPLQYSCLEDSMDRGAWWATVHGVTKKSAQLKQPSTHTCKGYSISSCETCDELTGKIFKSDSPLAPHQ